MRSGEQRSKRGRNLLVLAIIATLLATLLGWYIGVGRYDSAPRLVGSAEALAKKTAERNGFEFKVAGLKFSEEFASGVVISTDPGPGDKILPGDTINAILSKGPDRVVLPATLKGMTLAEATSALSALDLKVGKVTQNFDEKVAKDRVIGAVGIAATDQLRRDTVVDLSVSKGKKPIKVVDYTGKPAADAEKALTKAGFKVKINSEFSDTVAKGIVMAQSPREGTKFKGDTITLKASKGPDLVTVPNVVGMKRREAINTLKAAGFIPVSKPNPFDNRTVLFSIPASGQKAKRGSVVEIYGQ